MTSTPLAQPHHRDWATPVHETHVDITLDPTRVQRELLRRHAGLSRTVSNSSFHVAITEPLEHAMQRRNLGGRDPYRLKELAVWTPAELYEEWRTWQAADHPWAASLSAQVAFEACRYASARLADHYLHGHPYPRPLTRRQRRKFGYSDGCYPVGSDALHLDGVGEVATDKGLGLTALAKVKSATVRERGRSWQVRLRIEAP